MTDPLTPLDDELEQWLAPAREVRPVSPQRQAAALSNLRHAIAAGVSPPSAPTAALRRSRPWWFGSGLVLGVVLGAGAMWLARGPSEATQASSAPSELPAREVPVVESPPTPQPAQVVAAPPAVRERTRAPSREATRVQAVEPSPTAELLPAGPPHADSVAAERRIIDAALAQVSRGHAAEALASVMRHESNFPDGQLAEAREIVRLRALVHLHRLDDARTMFMRFERRFPRSSALTSLRDLAGEPSERVATE